MIILKRRAAAALERNKQAQLQHTQSELKEKNVFCQRITNLHPTAFLYTRTGKSAGI
jgi:hypothetical protein